MGAEFIAFHVRNMLPSDFDFAVHATDRMGWGLEKSDFEFMMELEPQGCFVLFEDSERVGLATTVSYGKIAWFGNLIVDEGRRRRGAGSLLVNHSLEYLRSIGVETVGLYAYMERISFYRRLGFRTDSAFLVMKGKAFSSSISADVRKVEERDIEKVVDFDRSCFGESRWKLLEPILSDRDNLGYFSVRGGKVVGYSVAKVFRGMAELGPIVCEKGQVDVAVNLLRATFDGVKRFEVSLFVPEKEEALCSMLVENGFSQVFKVERMFHGSPVAGDCVMMAESLERG
jgi:GNAT superfamily N-acetyltransferase